MYKMQILSVKRKTKKEAQQKTIPTFKNFKIDYSRVNDNNIEIGVIDVFGETDKGYKSLVLSVDKKGATFIISKIRCPFCNKPDELNEHWKTYICNKCEDHEKMNFELVQVL